jgi:hypothetical protein
MNGILHFESTRQKLQRRPLSQCRWGRRAINTEERRTLPFYLLIKLGETPSDFRSEIALPEIGLVTAP